MPIATRLTNTGTLIVNGMFDEFTGAPVVDSSLQLWLDAGQTSSYSGTGNTWSDLSVSGNALTLTNGPTFASTGGGGSIVFDGVDEYASGSVSPVFTGNAPHSIDLWFYLTSYSAGRSWILQLGPYTTGSEHWILYSATSTQFGVFAGAQLSPNIPLNTWINIITTFDGTTYTCYKNGVSVGSTAATFNFTGNILYLGLKLGGEFNMTGSIASCKLYSRALTGAEVVQNYNALRNRYALPAVTATQMPVVQRQLSSGTLLVNSGVFDEFTGAPVVDSSLTQWLDFGQTSSYSGSGTTVTDLSPTATASVTLTGSPTFNNIDGGGSEAFNGSTQYGTGSGTPLGLSAYTKSFWFKLTSYLPGNNVVSSDVGGHFCFFSGGNKLQSGHSFWSNYGAFTSVTTFALNTWYHACVTFNTSTGMALYVNGVLDSTYVSTSGTSPTNTPVTGTGRADIANYGTGNNLAGSIGQVMVYNRALTAAEIVQNYNALRNRYALPAVTATQMPVVQRLLRSGTLLVNSGGFDEFTGMASVVEGLVAYYDPAYSSSYSGAGANLYNLVDGVAATLNGTYSAGTAAVGTSVSGMQTIRLTNSDLVTATNNISHVQAPSFTNITTVSIWFYQHTYNGISRYILDGRTGGSEGWIYNGSIGSNWSTGIVYVNGGASSGTPAWANWGGTATGVWKNVTFIASTPFTDDINIFSRWSDNEGLDVTFGPILIYNRVLTQAENLQNFNALRNRYGI